MPITYSTTQINNGLDTTASPKWQMVPCSGQRTLNVTGFVGLQPRARDATIMVPTMTGQRLTLTGLKPGKTWVEWVPNMGFNQPVQNANLLEISVKAPKRIRTAFHYVRDNAGHHSLRSRGSLEGLISSVNAILTPQANVIIERKSSREITVPQNLGDVVRFSSHLQAAPHNVLVNEHEWDDVTAFADTTADFNVFFVWEYEQDTTPNINNTRAGTIAAEKNCLLDDIITNTAETLAHEVIHLLGISPHSLTASHSLPAMESEREGW
jgi:hypothetical protein